MELQPADVCVIGAGPAGCVVAARLAQLGCAVCLIERSTFPRRHLGESLSPGVLPLLDTIGARGEIESAGFTPVRRVVSNWDGPLAERVDPREQGLLVDRGRFDAALLERARGLGVIVLQPAVVRERLQQDDGWVLAVDANGLPRRLRVRLVVDATGRTAAGAGRRRPTGPRTLALYAYWRGRRLPDQPRIEAGASAWYWGVPIPGGAYNTLAFVDSDSLRTRAAPSLEGHFRELLGRSGLMGGCDDPRLAGRVAAADATPYLDERCVTPISIKVGDAALAIDPLSSSGVQKAVQTALAGAIVANTLLRKPEATAMAMQFYRDSLAQASARHCRWAAAHYATVSARESGSFWRARSVSGASRHEPAPTDISTQIASGAHVVISPDTEIVEVPLLGSEFVALGRALRHPGLDAPVAYLGGWELAPLLGAVRAGMTPIELVQQWSPHVPAKTGLAIAGWLLGHGILVPQPAAPRLERRA
jgi:flavin-dependent dehydrogenase